MGVYNKKPQKLRQQREKDYQAASKEAMYVV